jgi:hypothetical protein
MGIIIDAMMKLNVERLDQFSEGYCDFIDGIDRNESPYDPVTDTELYDAWLRGWECSKRWASASEQERKGQ